MDPKYVYLNLQEQVGKNKVDIAELKGSLSTIARALVVGQEATVDDLPDPSTYSGNIGDAYLIGTEEPYDLYIFVKPSVGEAEFKWVGVGEYPAPGPQGPQGPEGPKGDTGDASAWRIGPGNPSILETDREHDGYLNTTSGMVFEFDGETWVPMGSIRGPRGPQGVQGPQGPEGPQGMQGPMGPQGAAGRVVDIIDTVETVGSLPDPDTVPRNAGYLVDDGVTCELYIIVGEEGDLSWYDAGVFTNVPGTAAGFGTINSSTFPLTPGTAPQVAAFMTGPNTAKNIQFTFFLPMAQPLENSDAQTPSDNKGYTQELIDKKTLVRVFKSRSDLGIGAAAKTSEILVAVRDIPNCMIVISNDSDYANVTDTPKARGQLVIIQGSTDRNPDIRFIDDSYNVYLYAGSTGTPAVAEWYRVMTTHDAAIVGTPAGGTTGQILSKKSDDDFDTEWEDVPNAPNGIAAGGSTGQMLVKRSGTSYDTEWTTPPTGVPNGGSTGQMLVKQSNADGDTTWQTPPVGIPSAGSTGQALKKNSNDNYAATWQDTHEVPAEGTTGQVLRKKSNTNYDTEWATPAVGIPSGGSAGQVLTKDSPTDYDVSWQTPAGGGGSMVTFGKNLIINPFFTINQRNITSASSGTAIYTADRWYYKGDGSGISITTPAGPLGLVFRMTSGGTVSQFVEFNNSFQGAGYLLVGISSTNDSGITVKVKDSSGTEITASWTKVINVTPGALIPAYQHMAMVELSASPSTWLEIEFSGSTGTQYDMTGAFCYLLSDSFTSTEAIAVKVDPINGAEEMEKCKYYYQKVNAGTSYTPNSRAFARFGYKYEVVTATNSTTGEPETIRAYTVIQIGMRIIPTLDLTNFAYRYYYWIPDSTVPNNADYVMSVVSAETTKDAFMARTGNISISTGRRALGGYATVSYTADAEIYPS